MLLSDYFLEEDNVLSASQHFDAYIPDSLIVSQIENRIQADAILMKGSILAHQSHAKRAIPLLNQAVGYFSTHISGLPDNRKYFFKPSLNELIIKEKYVQANYMLAFGQFKAGNLKEAELALNSLIAWANNSTNKFQNMTSKMWLLLGEVYEHLNLTDKAINAFTKAYTENPHTDSESEKQQLLLNLIIKCNENGRKLDARNYIRRLEMKAAMHLHAKNPAQLAYELSLSHSQFLEQSYSTSNLHLGKIEKQFNYVPETHPYINFLYKLKSDLYYYQGNYSALMSSLEKQAKARTKTLNDDCPEYHRYKMEVALAEISFGKDLLKAKRIYAFSYFQFLEKELAFSSAENIKYLAVLSDLYVRLSQFDSATIFQQKALEANLQLNGENSSIIWLTGYDSSILTKDKLYKNALELYKI